MKIRIRLGILCLCAALLIVCQTAFADTKLQQGSSGSEVVSLQQALNSLGYSLVTDGKFGPATAAAVRSFQQAQGLKVDGIAGRETLRRLSMLTAGSVGAATAAPTYAPVQTAVPTYAPVQTAVPTYAPVQTAAPSGQVFWLRVKGGSLNLRQTPSIQAKVLVSIPNGSLLLLQEWGDTWCHVTYDVWEGYVMTQYVDLVSAAQSTATAAPAATWYAPAATATPVPTVAATPAPARSSAKVTGGSLNLRAGPGREYQAILTIPNGTEITLLSRGETWSQVEYMGVSGYVMTQYLTIGSSATAAPTVLPWITAAPVTAVPTAAWAATAAPTAPNPSLATVRGGSLNLRAGPGTQYRILTSIPNGRQVTLTSYGENWSAVTYQGQAGYVMTRYLTLGASATASPTVNPWSTAAPTVIPWSTTVPTVIPWSTAVPTAVPTAAPTAVPAAGYDTSVFTRTLRSGSTGQDVTALQERLKALNYLSAVTGTYDSDTVDAVKRFQAFSGLTEDGIAGPKTLTALFSSGTVSYTPSNANYQALHIYYGTRTTSSAIRSMQERLQALGYTVTVNGVFDETTYVAVLEFELRNGLTCDGAATPAMQALLYSQNARGYSAQPSVTLENGAGSMSLPDISQVKLLRWFDDVKSSLSSGSILTILDPDTGISFHLRLMSSGRHADSEPQTLRDTLLMLRAFGKPSWNVHPVYVLLPSGQWTVATMHNRPHLTGTINNNGFDGHLCVHFLRTMAECRQNDPDYGVSNQNTLRKFWNTLTGETIVD